VNFGQHQLKRCRSAGLALTRLTAPKHLLEMHRRYKYEQLTFQFLLQTSTPRYLNTIITAVTTPSATTQHYTRRVLRSACRLQLTISNSFTEMCDQRLRHYTQCGHQYAYDYFRCPAALAREGQTVCVPASGNLRDLPRSLDAADRNLPGLCPACAGKSPTSSRNSQ
jgi:hypothetical protein